MVGQQPAGAVGRGQGAASHMLRVSKITDYGIVVLTHLAEEAGGPPHTARQLAEEAGLPVPVVSKTLKRLARWGLLESHRGARGGYSLAREPEDVSLAEIIEALEGPIGLMECSIEVGQCRQEPSCRVRAPWQRINRVIQETFEQVTLTELMRPETPGTPAAPDGSGLLQVRMSPPAGSS